MLLALLIQKEIFSVSDSPKFKAWGRILNVGIVPLGIAFVLIVTTRMLEVFG